MNPYAIAAYFLFAVALIGGGALYDETPFVFTHFAVDALILFASMTFFLAFLHRKLGTPGQIFVGMALGVLLGWIMKEAGRPEFVTDYLNIFGRIFLLALTMVIVPLVFVSVLLGVAGLGDIRKVGALGGKTLAYYFTTTGIAILIGLACVDIIRPGAGLSELIVQVQVAEPVESAPGEDAEAPPPPKPSTGKTLQDSLLPRILQSPIRTDEFGVSILAVIMFAILFGAALMADPERSAPAIKVFQAIDKAMVTLVIWIMALAPIGVFALMANAIATLGIEYIQQLSVYFLTVLLGLVLHFSLLVFVVVPRVGKISWTRFLRGMAPAMQVAFSTSSSSATLPVSIECAIERVGLNKGVTRFMLPVGATINMDGTALYTAVASIFVAQVYGMDMGFTEQLMIFLTAVAVSVGTAGIPGASLAMMTIIFTAVQIPIEGIGLIVGLDRVLDMCRTTVNITGDSAGAAVLSRFEPETPEEVEVPVQSV
jgi:Na+/H+-dicarboxylate symporter